MLGIDVSKDHLVCALRDQTTRHVVWEHTVANTQAGIATLLEKTPAHSAWVLEPTGRYSLLAVTQAQQAGRQVLLAPPRRAKLFLQSVQTRAKTDKLDSKGLALFALSQELSPFPVKDEAVETVEQLLSARKGVSEAIMRLQLQQGELPHAAAYLEQAVTGLREQQKALDKEIARRATTEPTLSSYSSLLGVPGIGKVTAASVSACLASRQFSHPDKFVAYVGLDVSVRDSGKSAGQRRLTHQGDAELRRLLYLCAQSSLRCKGSPFKEQYERERAKGLSSTAALCAVARKLAKLCWSLHKHGTTYDPARVGVQQTKTTAPEADPT